jgi:hypothetical protein
MYLQPAQRIAELASRRNYSISLQGSGVASKVNRRMRVANWLIGANFRVRHKRQKSQSSRPERSALQPFAAVRLN